MTIDELRERLHSYEPLHYDYDPFDPEGKYLLGSHKARRNRRSMSRPDSPGFDAYSYNNGCLGRTASQYGARDFGCPKYPSRPESYAEQHSSTFGGLPSSDSCSCITMYGDIFCRKPYTHRLQNTISKYHRPLDSVFFDDDHESATIPLMNEYSGSGYSSEDDRMFSTPSISSSPLLSRRRSTSALQPRPILRRGNSYTRPLPKPRGRRVSFEDEQNLGDEGESMFITAPGFPHSPRYF